MQNSTRTSEAFLSARIRQSYRVKWDLKAKVDIQRSELRENMSCEDFETVVVFCNKGAERTLKNVLMHPCYAYFSMKKIE